MRWRLQLLSSGRGCAGFIADLAEVVGTCSTAQQDVRLRNDPPAAGGCSKRFFYTSYCISTKRILTLTWFASCIYWHSYMFLLNCKYAEGDVFPLVTLPIGECIGVGSWRGKWREGLGKTFVFLLYSFLKQSQLSKVLTCSKFKVQPVEIDVRSLLFCRSRPL